MAIIPIYVDGTRMRVDSPPQLTDLLRSKLTFTEHRFLQGYEKRVAQAQGWDTREDTFVQCFHVDRHQRILTDTGFLTPVKNFLIKHGYEPDVRYIWSADATRWIFDWERVNRYYPTLDPDQIILLKMIIADRHRGGTANLPTGWGKGDIIGALCAGFKKLRIHVIVVGLPTIRQRLIPELSSKMIDFGVRGGGMKTNPKARVMLISANSLDAIDKEKVDLVLVDEARRIVADSHMERLAQYHRCIMWGLDATFDKRIDGKNYRRQQMFGDMRFKQSFKESEAKGRVLPVVVVWHRFRMDVDPAAGIKDDVKYKRETYWVNDLRNQLVARILKQAIRNGNQVFVATATIEHALNVRQYCPGTALVYGETKLKEADRRYYEKHGLLGPEEGEMTFDRIKQVTDDFTSGKCRAAIANLVWNYGVSFDFLKETVYASGVVSYESCNQVSGRLTRKSPGKTHGIHNDIWDTFSSKAKRDARKRFKVYEDLGYDQVIYNPALKQYERFYGQ